MAKKRRLTIKQKKFIEYYIRTMNGNEAAKLAGYKGDYHTMSQVAYDNMRKPHIVEEVNRRLRELTMGTDEVVYRLHKQATGSMEDFLDITEAGDVEVDLRKAKRRGVLALIKEIKHDKYVDTDKDGNTHTTYRTTVRLHDSQQALDKLMRFYGMYNDSLRIEDWKTAVVEALQQGELDPDTVREAYPDLAVEFFQRAGLEID